MPELRLTERRILDIPIPVDVEYERYWDADVRGLCVKVLRSGKKKYEFKDRLNGKPIWGKNLPRCSDTTLADMRGEAIQWKAAIRRGENPWVVVKEEKRPLTVSELCRENLAALSQRTTKILSEEHLKDFKLSTQWVEKDQLGAIAISEVTVVEAEVFLGEFSGRRAEHVRAWLRNCYNLAINRSYVPLGFNPWKYCERKYTLPEPGLLPRCTDEDIEQIAKFLKSTEVSICPIWKAFVWLLIRTGARPSDGRKIHRKWLQQRNGHWVIFHENTKTGRKTMALPAALGRDLDRLPRREENPFLFPGENGAPLSKKQFYRDYNIMREDIGIEKPPYAIRRWFAKTGRSVFDGDIEPVQQLVGWDSKEIAERYAGDDEALLDAAIIENAAVCRTINTHIDKVVGL